MKKILSFIAIMLAALSGFSQAPGFLNYQGVARNSVGNVLVNKTINLRLTIRDGSAAGPTVYQESRTVTTNPFGLFNVQVGSPGGGGVIGTITGVNWAVGAKFIQVEIDPNGGSSFINIGTAQLASVPYSLFAALAGDLVLPFNKTQADAGTLFRITNSNTTSAGATALEGLTNSTAGNANAIIGTVTSTAPGGFSAGVRGINNGTGGNGIGVYGSQAGSGWGVHGIAPSGIGGNFTSASGTGVFGSSTSGTGVNGSSNSGTGVFGTSSTGNAGVFSITNSANAVPALDVSSNGAAGSRGIRSYHSGLGSPLELAITNSASTNNVFSSTQTGLGRSGLVQITNTANTDNALEVATLGLGRAGAFTVNNTANGTQALDVSSNGAAGSRGIRSYHSGLGSPLELSITNTASTNNVFSSTQTGLGRSGLIQITNAANTDNALDAFTAGTGWAGRFFSNNATPRALLTAGAVRLTGINEGLNRILTSDATGNATWQPASAAGIVTGTGTTQFIPRWTSASNIGNSLLFDNGTSVGLGTTTPTHRFDVTHSGSTGIGVNSTSGFSVVDINAASGDAALRFAKAGVNQWNTRNRPADDYYEIFELGGGGSRFVIQDGTGNVGIGATVSPSYKLDVEHGGSTGLRVLSTSSFSVIDIDANSGDAALRFAKAGVNQWNTRNRPADDYYEIFELGGGGSRFVIQDGTGNVGIGATVSPSYKLDVEHGGSTGIRSKSTSSFSVVDIDAQSGDAALRFQKAGVNQWNIRNRPADDYLEIFELGGGGSRLVIQDATGNVGIGATVSPSYKLDVEHGGSTGIRSKSTSSFSVVDIDAQSGDAALRFQKAGVNQWNVRNRPADDYFEIFELGGGGSRFVIQDATGNVGIGATVAPSYKLDVEHGGSTGLRVLSTASFSVVDIDAQSGDAALRFIKAGVNQWNTRNNPGTDDYQIFELGGGGERMRIDNTTGKVWVNGDFTVVGVKAFTMDHPLDPANKTLMHVAAESNEVINFYSGNVTTDASGKAVVILPEYFEAINKDFRYQLTVIGSFAQAIISKEVSNNKFEIATSVPNVKVSWEVKGVRNDARMQRNPFVAVQEKTAAQKGKYIDPASHDQPMTKHVSYNPGDEKSSLNYAPATDKKSAPATTGGSLDQGAIVPPAAQKVATGGSLDQPKIVAPANKIVDKSGSVEDVKPAEKKAEVKPVDTKGTSIEEKTKTE
jgi:hypothetical protein